MKKIKLIFVFAFMFLLSSCDELGLSLDDILNQNFDTFTVDVHTDEDDLNFLSMIINTINNIDQDSVTYDLSELNLDEVGEYTITVTYPQNGEEVTKTFTIKVVDRVAPVIQGVNDFTIDTSDEVPNWLEGVTATDNYDGNLTDDLLVDADSFDITTLGEQTITYSVTDSSGNPTEETITVTVVDDVPIIHGLTDLEFGLGEDISNIDWLEGVSVTDSTDGMISITESNVDASNVDVNTYGDYEVTYTVTDSDGMTTTETRVVKIVDKTPPTFEGLSDLDIEVGTNIVAVDWLQGISVTDNVDGTIPLTNVEIDFSSINFDTPGVYDVTFLVTDSAGNTARETITVTITNVE